MLLFDAGYKRHGEFTVKKICEGESALGKGRPAIFTWYGQQIVPESFSFRESKALLWATNEYFYYTEWRNDTMISHDFRA
jgi:hypothetical protein